MGLFLWVIVFVGFWLNFRGIKGFEKVFGIMFSMKLVRV